jgi:hypothetical protein
MATRSRIGIEHEDGKITSIYCHWDGYPEHHLPILQGHYLDREKVIKLIELGALSSLEPEVEPTGPHTFDRPQAGVCVAYDRDHGEKSQDEVEHKDLEDFRDFAQQGWAEWLYVFGQDGIWKVMEC